MDNVVLVLIKLFIIYYGKKENHILSKQAVIEPDAESGSHLS